MNQRWHRIPCTHTITHTCRKLSNCTQGEEFFKTIRKKKNRNIAEKRACVRERDRKSGSIQIAEEWDVINVECLLMR